MLEPDLAAEFQKLLKILIGAVLVALVPQNGLDESRVRGCVGGRRLQFFDIRESPQAAGDVGGFERRQLLLQRAHVRPGDGGVAAGLLADARGVGVGGAGARRSLVGAGVGIAEDAVATAGYPVIGQITQPTRKKFQHCPRSPRPIQLPQNKNRGVCFAKQSFRCRFRGDDDAHSLELRCLPAMARHRFFRKMAL